MNVLVFLDFFTPAFKAGGPIRVFESLAQEANEEMQLSIVTQNVDWGDSIPLDVPVAQWTSFRRAKVLYLDQPRRSMHQIAKTISDSRAEVVHLNSLFSRTWTLKILLLRRLGVMRKPVFISPHGELAASALGIKTGRKAAFLKLGRFLGLFKGLHWIATTSKEQKEILHQFGNQSVISVVTPPLPDLAPYAERSKTAGLLKLIFFARIGAMKNLPFLIEALNHLKGELQFDIYGPVDPNYEIIWTETLRKLQELPIQCRYIGPIPSHNAAATLAQYDLFVQPSLSENFGYSIVEALAAGTPVLISDQTPWNDVNTRSVGYALSLDNVSAWRKVLQSFIEMDDREWQLWSERAREWTRDQIARQTSMSSVYLTTRF